MHWCEKFNLPYIPLSIYTVLKCQPDFMEDNMDFKRTGFKTGLFFLITGLYWFSLYTYVPVLSTYSLSLGATYKMTGLIIGSYGFAQLLIRIPVGIISDKTGKRKPVIFAGCISSLVAALLFYRLQVPTGALAARFISGIGASAWVVFPVFFISMFKGDDSAKSIGYISSVMKIGQVAATYVGGLIAFSVGTEYTFLYAGGAALTALILCLILKEERVIQREPLTLKSLFTVLKSKELIRNSLLAVVMQFMTFATVYGFTPVIAQAIGATEKQLGLLTSLSTLPGIPAAALSGVFFAKRFSSRRTVQFGFFIYSISLLFIPFTKNLNVLFLTQIIGGFANGIVFPLLMTGSVNEIPDDKKGSAMGFFQAVYGLGMLAGPFITGLFSDVGAMTFGLVFTACLGFLGVISFKIKIKNSGS